jgi:hypothetical protein
MSGHPGFFRDGSFFYRDLEGFEGLPGLPHSTAFLTPKQMNLVGTWVSKLLKQNDLPQMIVVVLYYAVQVFVKTAVLR